jgi:hypothetical protein
MDPIWDLLLYITPQTYIHIIQCYSTFTKAIHYIRECCFIYFEIAAVGIYSFYGQTGDCPEAFLTVSAISVENPFPTHSQVR